jgi:protein-S-isoprenylcysteine O-methyltransferase Ste14
MPNPTPPKLVPPFWFLVGIGVMVLLHRTLPLATLVRRPWNWIGLAVLLAAVALSISGAALFRRRGTAVRPLTPSSLLVTDGPYRFTRNPMYLGLTLGLIGIAILLGSASPLLVIPPFVWWISTRFIAREEQFLTEQFGESYLQYKRQVRRWV